MTNQKKQKLQLDYQLILTPEDGIGIPAPFFSMLNKDPSSTVVITTNKTNLEAKFPEAIYFERFRWIGDSNEEIMNQIRTLKPKTILLDNCFPDGNSNLLFNLLCFMVKQPFSLVNLLSVSDVLVHPNMSRLDVASCIYFPYYKANNSSLVNYIEQFDDCLDKIRIYNFLDVFPGRTDDVKIKQPVVNEEKEEKEEKVEEKEEKPVEKTPVVNEEKEEKVEEKEEKQVEKTPVETPLSDKDLYKLEFRFLQLLKRSLKDDSDFETFHLFLTELTNEMHVKNPNLKSMEYAISPCRPIDCWKKMTRNFILIKRRQGLYEQNEISEYVCQIRSTVDEIAKKNRLIFDEIYGFFKEQTQRI